MRCLWSPWRMDYILKGKEKGCIFCKRLKKKDDRKSLILFRTPRAFVMMNRFPYNTGHLMIMPTRHAVDLNRLRQEEWRELVSLLTKSIQVLKKALKPHGFNIGMNIGIAGGAGEKHVHLHVVPRWKGDTNFMPLLTETKVIPEYLESTYLKLRAAFESPLPPKKQGKGGPNN